MADLKLTENQKQLLVMAGAGIVFLILGWWLLVQAGFVKINAARREASVARERSELIADLHDLKVKSRGLQDLLPREEDRYGLLGKLTALAKESGFAIESIVPRTEPAEPYAKLTLNLEAGVSFPSLMGFLARLEELKPIVVVSGMEVTNRYGRGARSLRGTTPKVGFKLETFLK